MDLEKIIGVLGCIGGYEVLVTELKERNRILESQINSLKEKISIVESENKILKEQIVNHSSSKQTANIPTN